MSRLLLKNNSRIAIIGAGPAGTLCAKFLTDFAKKSNLTLDIVIFDGKRFTASGPRGCNMCAGVVAETLVNSLEKVGLSIPESVIQRRIKGYRLNTRAGILDLDNPKESDRILTVFRGSGPDYSIKNENISFDNFLLNCALESGVKVIPEAVNNLILPSDPQEVISVIYGQKEQEQTFLAEAVVIACGLNTGFLKKIEELNFGYVSPRVVNTCQIELRLEADYIEEHFANRVYVYELGIPHIRFAAMVPKKEHVTVTVVGDENVKKMAVWEFLHHPLVRKDLPLKWKIPQAHCHCHPRIALSASKNPFTNRMVVIGDASCSRYYKNGLESAYWTARYAASSMINSGLGKDNFAKNYFKKCKKFIIDDNYYGQMVFKTNNFVTKSLIVTKAHLQFAQSTLKPSSRRLREILWNIFTGNISYKDIFFKILDLKLQLPLLFYTLKVYLKSILVKEINYERRILLGPLDNEQTVVIIGGGPGGTSCAIALKKLALSKNKNINVILYEPKDFDNIQNQCVGVLSPPFETLLKEKLDITFPPDLIQRKIEGYVLHSDNNQIFLSGEDKTGPTYVIRRRDLDNFLLEEAKKLGVQVIKREVTEIEFFPETARVFSGNNNHEVDCLVAASGMEADMLFQLEEQSAYRRPVSLKSVITNITADEKFIEEKLGNIIHAYLPSLKNVEFGAITPKKDHITVNICGANVTTRDMNAFLKLPQVRELLPDYEGLVYFKGTFPIGPAKNFFWDRFVAVGDVGGLIRPLKGKGINSAVATGAKAARVIVDLGFSKEAFREYYRNCQDLIDDNYYGLILRFLSNISSHTYILDRLISLAKKDLVLYRAFYNIVSGHETYKNIVKETLGIGFLARLWLSLINPFVQDSHQ